MKPSAKYALNTDELLARNAAAPTEAGHAYDIYRVTQNEYCAEVSWTLAGARYAAKRFFCCKNNATECANLFVQNRSSVAFKASGSISLGGGKLRPCVVCAGGGRND